ncbi:MAG: metallophosphoesterase [Oligoflexia bacterium]|nr:metallophosphoesterase [Oligoflexia bacterium]
MPILFLLLFILLQLQLQLFSSTTTFAGQDERCTRPVTGSTSNAIKQLSLESAKGWYSQLSQFLFSNQYANDPRIDKCVKKTARASQFITMGEQIKMLQEQIVKTTLPKEIQSDLGYGDHVVVGDIHGYLLGILQPLLLSGFASIDKAHPFVVFDTKNDRAISLEECLRMDELKASTSLVIIPNLKLNINNNINHNRIVFLGDYLDRGELDAESLLTLLWLMRQVPVKEKNAPIKVLLGNHEIDLLRSPSFPQINPGFGHGLEELNTHARWISYISTIPGQDSYRDLLVSEMQKLRKKQILRMNLSALIAKGIRNDQLQATYYSKKHDVLYSHSFISKGFLHKIKKHEKAKKDNIESSSRKIKIRSAIKDLLRESDNSEETDSLKRKVDAAFALSRYINEGLKSVANNPQEADQSIFTDYKYSTFWVREMQNRDLDIYFENYLLASAAHVPSATIPVKSLNTFIGHTVVPEVGTQGYFPSGKDPNKKFLFYADTGISETGTQMSLFRTSEGTAKIWKFKYFAADNSDISLEKTRTEIAFSKQ